MADGLAVLVESPCLEGIAARVKRMVAYDGLCREDALLVHAFHPVEDGAACAVVEVKGAEVDVEVVEVVGQGEADCTIVPVEEVAALTDVGRKKAAVHLDVRNEQGAAHLRTDLRGVEDGDALFAAKDEGVVVAAGGATLVELIALHTVVGVIGLETSRRRVEARKAVEGAYPDVACRTIDLDARHVGAHVLGAEVAHLARIQVQAEHAHADGGYPDAPLVVLGYVAAADHALLFARKVEVGFGKGVGVEDGDARIVRSRQDASVVEFLDVIDLPQVVVEDGRGIGFKVDDVASRLCSDPDSSLRVFTDGIDVVVGRKVMQQLQPPRVGGAAFVDVTDSRKQEVPVGTAGDVHDVVGSHLAHVHFGHLAAKVTKGDVRTSGAYPQAAVGVSVDGGDVLAGEVMAEFSVIDESCAAGEVCLVAAASRTAPEVPVAVAQEGSDFGGSDGGKSGVADGKLFKVDEPQSCFLAQLDSQHISRQEHAECFAWIGNPGIEKVARRVAANGAVGGVHDAESGIGDQQGAERVECEDIRHIGVHRTFALVVELNVVQFEVTAAADPETGVRLAYHLSDDAIEADAADGAILARRHLQGIEGELVVVIAQDEAVRKFDGRTVAAGAKHRGCAVGEDDARSDEGGDHAPVGVMREVTYLHDVVVGQRAAVGIREVLHVGFSIEAVQPVFGAYHDVALGTFGKGLDLLARQAIAESRVVVPGHAWLWRESMDGSGDQQQGKQATHADEQPSWRVGGDSFSEDVRFHVAKITTFCEMCK